jgi:hypothetical protein
MRRRMGEDTSLLERYLDVRRATERLCEPLAIEDYVVQAMPDASPAKWHLAHVSWFFETFLLRPYAADYSPLDERYAVLFNSYYNGVGPQFERPARGTLSRPTAFSLPRRSSSSGCTTSSSIRSCWSPISSTTSAPIRSAPSIARSHALAAQRRRTRSSNSRAASSRSATRARNSPSTTNGRGIESRSRHMRSARGS